MGLNRLTTRLWRNERGAVAVMVALGMIVFLGSAAIAIDLGHMMNVRAESQRVSDLAALAGASAFVDANGVALQATAEQRALDFAAQNTVNRSGVALAISDIQVDIPNERVRVTVSHTAARGNPIQTVFARAIGINDVDIVTTAVAEAFPAVGANCILPFMLPDKYQENGGNPNLYDGSPDYYERFDVTLSPPSLTSTGYTSADIGVQILIKPGNKSKAAQPNPSWYYPIVVYGTGAASYRAAIIGCPDPSIVLAIGDFVPVEPGAMIGPTKQGVKALIAQAPDHAWSTSKNCVIDTGAGANSNVCIASPRLRPVPMLAPPDAPGNGRKNVPITNWAGVFIESMQGNDVIARFAGYSGFMAATTGGGAAGAIAKIIRLVE